MANLQLPINHDHEVLGSEYCSGYMDALGKWNNGFYCPASDESQDVFCCGTESHKYCCTKKDQVIQSEVQDLTVLIGVLVGASAAIMIITLVSCFCCSCCLLYKKRNPSTMSMYRLHNSSEHSGVTNMYSLSASRSGTPTQVLGGGGTQTSALLHNQPYHHQPGILVGGANHPSNHPGHVSNTLSYPQHAHNHTASQFTLQLDELDQMQMMQHQQGGADGQLNGGMSHSHTLPHNLSHQRYRASPDIISHQVNTRPRGTSHYTHSHNQPQHQTHQHHQEAAALHQHYSTLGRMPAQHHHLQQGGPNNQGFDMIPTVHPPNSQLLLNGEGNPDEAITTSFIGNVDILEPVSNAGVLGGISDTTPHTVNPSSNIHQQPKVVYATHGSHHHHHQNTTVEPPKEDQQLFHSTKF